MFALRLVSKHKVSKQTNTLSSNNEEHSQEVEPNPYWSQKETVAFNKTCLLIEEMTTTLLPWNELPWAALDVIQKIATEIGGESKKPLDFSAPEALLLIEKTATRYRGQLQQKMPFADQVAISKLYWIWTKRKKLTLAWKLADGGRRLARFASNPAGAAVKELEQLITGGNTQYLSDQMLGTLQIIFLEEVASVAVDLYSGRLRFSEDELQNIALESAHKDKKLVAKPDNPLRILIMGQVSSGKSSLVNNILAVNAAETDVAASTNSFVNYEIELQGQACSLLDSPGIDGTEQNRQWLLNELTDSDIVLWTLRADRPSRAADVALLDQLHEWAEKKPMHRKPIIIFVVTFIDRIAYTWPTPEHEPLKENDVIFEKLISAISSDIHEGQLILISNAQPAWNIDLLASTIASQFEDGLMIQRNRRRLSAHKQSSSVIKKTTKSLGGLYKSAKFLGGRWYKTKQEKIKDDKK